VFSLTIKESLIKLSKATENFSAKELKNKYCSENTVKIRSAITSQLRYRLENESKNTAFASNDEK